MTQKSNIPSDPYSALLQDAAARALGYLTTRPQDRVSPTVESLQALDEQLRQPLPDKPLSSGQVIEFLDRWGSPATMNTVGGRYFGLVVGGAVPASVAAGWLVAAWDQNAALRMLGHAAVMFEDAALSWAAELFRLPPGTGGALVTGGSMANLTCLAAARQAILKRSGWNADLDGLFGAPPVRVVVSAEIHPTVLKALGLIGFGRQRVERVDVDSQGRARLDRLPKLDASTIICIQAGNVNTGSFDFAQAICERARDCGAWVHVDGAFGLWAWASPKLRPLVSGLELADSWATDSHKWPNSSYDCGLAFVRDAESLRDSMRFSAAYVATGSEREPLHHNPEMSRRARGVELWATLRSLGKSGLAELVDRTCAHAQTFARELEARGYTILNDVVINQVLVSFGPAEVTRAIITYLQEDGTCWFGGTEWQGHVAMRISVCSWATTDDDVRRSLDAIDRAAARVSARPL
jgi:glutamate/tyrosine decarboxylase-like PLP-dependent enzyme